MIQKTNVLDWNILRLSEASWVKKAIVRSVFGLGLAVPIAASSQLMPTAVTSIHSDGKIVAFSFGGLSWRMPYRLFQGVRPFTNDSKELLIQFGWEKSTDTFAAVDAYPNDMKLSVHVRNVQVEDPRNALDFMIHRSKLPFKKTPLFADAKFQGMIYLGSSSSIHYFVLDHEDAYVSCMLMDAGTLMPSEMDPDILSRKFRCDTTFRLSHDSSYYAWMTSAWVDLNDVGSAFISARREIISFIP